MSTAGVPMAAPGDSARATTGGGSPEISAALQRLVEAVSALSAVLSGTGTAAAAGGGAGAAQLLPAQGFAQSFAPSALAQATAAHGEHQHAPSVSAGATIGRYGLGADVANEAGSTTNVSNSQGDWKRTYARPAADRAKGAQTLQTMMQSTAAYGDISAAQAAGYDFSKAIVEGTLVHVPNVAYRQQFGGADPSHPAMLLYRKSDAGYTLIGNVMQAAKQGPDFGMGNWHTHQKAGTTGGNVDLMMHVWYLPGDLDAAFSETIPKR